MPFTAGSAHCCPTPHSCKLLKAHCSSRRWLRCRGLGEICARLNCLSKKGQTAAHVQITERKASIARFSLFSRLRGLIALSQVPNARDLRHPPTRRFVRRIPRPEPPLRRRRRHPRRHFTLLEPATRC